MDNNFGIILLIVLILMATIIIIEGGKHGKKHRHKIKLGAIYFIENFKILVQMATINIPQDKNSVNGQLVPTQSGNPLDLSFIQPDTDSYSSSDTNIANVSKTGNGTFTVSRVAPEGGTVTISYSANNTQGNQISGSDTVIFDAVVVPIVADALTATFSEPQ